MIKLKLSLQRKNYQAFWWGWGKLLLLGLGVALVLSLSLGERDGDWQKGIALAVTVVTFVSNAVTQFPTELIFLGGLGILLITGTLDEKDALAGFSNSGMLTVAVLYVVVTGLEQTGGMDWISQRLLGKPKGLLSALWRMMMPVIGISAFLNNTPVVAIFIKVVDEWCRKINISPSKLMMPLSFAAIFGGVCTLIGTSTNLVVNGMLISQANHPGIGLFDLTPVGLPCAIFGALYLLVIARWIPERISFHGRTDDPREYTVEMVVKPNSPLVGKSIEEAGLRHLPSLFLTEIEREGQLLQAVSPQIKLRPNDQLIFVGAKDSVIDLQRFRGLQPATNQIFKLDGDRSQRSLIEAVVSNTCPLVGKTIREGHFRNFYNAVVLAVCRNGERLKGKIGDIQLAAGDTLLLEARPSFIEQQRNAHDFYLVSGIPNSEPINYVKAPIALIILIVMVILASLTEMGMLNAAILAAILMLVTGCCSAERAIKSIEWPVLLVIAAALGIGKALETTGAASDIANIFLSFAGKDPWVSLVVIYGLTTFITEVITNNAAAALIFPFGYAISQSLAVDVLPFAIAIMIGASASFATPIGYQTNLMVYGPGGYRFSDFLKIGIPLNLVFWIVAVIIIPWVYPW